MTLVGRNRDRAVLVISFVYSIQSVFGTVFPSGTERIITVLLPPISEGWGKVLFSVCLSVHTSMVGGG